MSSYAEQYTLYQIANAPLREYPFPHILVSDIFEPAFYRRLQENLLPAELMQPIKAVRPVGKGYSDERFVFTIEPEAVAALPQSLSEFWSDLGNWLLAMPMAVTLLNKFGRYIQERFGGEPPGVYNEAMLVDDRNRYSLGPHSDSPSKVLTLLFYLPADASRPNLGTSLYAPRDPSFRCPGGPHYPYDKFERVITMPYLPNTLFAFVKSDVSFHGVEPIESGDYRRQLLFYDIKCTLPEPGADERPKVEFKM
jgi:hypothetical protein